MIQRGQEGWGAGIQRRGGVQVRGGGRVVRMAQRQCGQQPGGIPAGCVAFARMGQRLGPARFRRLGTLQRRAAIIGRHGRGAGPGLEGVDPVQELRSRRRVAERLQVFKVRGGLRGQHGLCQRRTQPGSRGGWIAAQLGHVAQAGRGIVQASTRRDGLRRRPRRGQI